MFGPINPIRRRVQVTGGLRNPCGEIILGSMQECNLGYKCTSCGVQVVGSKDGICGRCLQEAQLTEQATECGTLLDGQFYCLDCGVWFPGLHEHVSVSMLKPYSQICICCRKVVFRGALPWNRYPADYSNSRRILGV